jgi:3'-phosphoadenosine 5'-phosphosulfate sulfotransferase (PAPS reductase)/FAD synthetase
MNSKANMLFDKFSEDEALHFIKEHEPPEGYMGLFSGGKDSCVIKHLAKQAGVKAV